MFLDVVIAACAALAAVGLVMAGFKLFRASPPRWMMAAVAALAIIAVTAAVRYQWADRTAGLLPPHMVVVERLEEKTLLEPWSLVQPVATELVVADSASIKRNPAHPGMAMIDILLLRRDAETLIQRHLVDCAGKRDAVVTMGAGYGPDGLPAGLEWVEGGPAKLFETACAQERAEAPPA